MQGGEFSGQLFKYIVITNTTKFITTNVGTHRLNGLNSSLLVATGAAVAVPRFCLCLCLCPCPCPYPCPWPYRCRCGWGWDDAVVEWVGPTLSGWTVLSPWHDVWTLMSIWSVGGEDEDSLLPITAFGFIQRWKYMYDTLIWFQFFKRMCVFKLPLINGMLLIISMKSDKWLIWPIGRSDGKLER